MNTRKEIIKNWRVRYESWLKDRLDKNPHRSFNRTPPYLWRPDLVTSLKSSWSLISETFGFILKHKRIMLGLGLLYAALSYFLVGGLSQVDYSAFKDASMKVFGGDLGAVNTSFSLFSATISGAFNAPTSTLQQFLSGFMSIFFWLALVWAARMLSAGKSIKFRDALYNSGGPFIPSLVILAVICIQTIPAAIGIFAYATATNGQWLHGGVEAMVFAAAAVLLSLLSLYWLVSSFIGLVVVTLPGMYPMRALMTARELVLSKRWGIVIRIVAMGIVGLLIWALVLIPAFMLDNWLKFSWLPLIPVALQALTGFSLVFTSTYIYKLYRSLL